MHFSRISTVLSFASLAFGAPSEFSKRDLTSYVAQEKAISLQGVLNNIGPDGSQVAGAGPYVVASPSKVDPDCKSSASTRQLRY